MNGVEATGDGGFIVTGDDIGMYRLLALRGALHIEIRTGMRMGRGRTVLSILQAEQITTRRTKKAALADLNAYIAAAGGPADRRPQLDPPE